MYESKQGMKTNRSMHGTQIFRKGTRKKGRKRISSKNPNSSEINR
jgi:hypothetical protein